MEGLGIAIIEDFHALGKVPKIMEQLFEREGKR